LEAVESVWLGCVDYKKALDMQLSYVDRRAGGETQDTLLLLTHPHVYTIGRSGDQANLLVSEEVLTQEGILVERVSRGGDVTYHGPGQLVGYPIVRLERPDLHRFVRCLESALIDALGTFGVSSHRIEGQTGVWVEGKKIASIGVGVRRWVTYHGFALNVATDLTYFQRIHLCGLKGREATSMIEITGRDVPMEEVCNRVSESSARHIRGFS
jgi:lipoyl(octanoyl) transferase